MYVCVCVFYKFSQNCNKAKQNYARSKTREHQNKCIFFLRIKMSNKSRNLLVGVTGSVAAIKLNELVDQLRHRMPELNICVIPTRNSLKFLPDFDEKFNQIELTRRLEILKSGPDRSGEVFWFGDADEWAAWTRRNDPVLHIELRKWADVCVIAPLDANTLAKISNGLCDNLLTSVIRAWDVENARVKPVMVCPAMNTCMYSHPITKRQLDVVREEFGFTVIEPVEKTLMCGDRGLGAMAHVNDIVQRIYDFLLIS